MIRSHIQMYNIQALALDREITVNSPVEAVVVVEEEAGEVDTEEEEADMEVEVEVRLQIIFI